ncbi:Cytosol aminopeptidase [Actinomyces bovis]|uniref:Probable cytosol aminopeptidase n=2 Tax=Actinomyces bovis TaxID=1658 RepID=A0ABY1VQT8_9ACTO|nr:Cytosol aminopeptidase [Actinomyces bovis]VEG53650.1 Cytosol aminopeptidase [Actinomyces israelii]
MTSDQDSVLSAEVIILAAAPAQAPEAAPVLLLPEAGFPGLDAAEAGKLLARLGFRASTDEVLRLPATALLPESGRIDGSVLVVGAGSDWDRAQDPCRDVAALGTTRDQVLRRLAGRGVRALTGCQDACLVLPTDTAKALGAVLEGALLGGYTWTGASKPAKAPLAKATVLSPLANTATGESSLKRAQVVADAVALTRDLVNEPPNRLNPVTFAQRAADMSQAENLEVLIRDEAQLAAEGFGGIVGVGQGSPTPPRLVRMAWVPPEADATTPHVALIGKGVTFDSGGLSLKPPASMPEMKSDMAGAATVLAVVRAAARLELPIKVTAWLALAENMPGSSAQRPSDIVTMVNGTTVEITNTDAEGRLVMADALAQAVTESPSMVLDVATLTGAQLVALGERVTGVMGTPSLRDRVVACAQAAGEAAWPMPLPEDLRSKLDSPYADLRNSAVGSRWGGMLVAGLFLREFVGQTDWAHLDVAGPAFNDGAAWGLTSTGGTGAGVATLLGLLEDCCKSAQAS